MMMMGAVSSNFFRVKDVQKFAQWLEYDVEWGQNGKVREQEGLVRYFGWGADSTYLQPMRVPDYDGDEEPDPLGLEEPEPWDVTEFAARLREHLPEPQEVRFVSAFLDIYGVPTASILLIPVSGPPFFMILDPFDEGMLQELQEKVKLAA